MSERNEERRCPGCGARQIANGVLECGSVTGTGINQGWLNEQGRICLRRQRDDLLSLLTNAQFERDEASAEIDALRQRVAELEQERDSLDERLTRMVAEVTRRNDDLRRTIAQRAADTFGAWRGGCGHVWMRQEYDACPTCASAAQRDTLADRLRRLLMSADSSWEDRGEGHDWREACAAARRQLQRIEKGDGDE